MESLNLMEGIKFNDSHPIARPIHVDKNGRVLQFALKPGQVLKEHSSASSPVYLLVLKGEGVLKAAVTLKQPPERALSLYIL